MVGDGTMEPELGNRLDSEGSGLLILGRKKLDKIDIRISKPSEIDGREIDSDVFPMDSRVIFIYKSFSGGLVPPGFASEAMLTQTHYASGWFEGIRTYDSPFGLVLKTPWKNYVRAEHSSTSLHPNLALRIKELFDKHPDLASVHCPVSLIPRSLYDLAGKCFRNGEEVNFPLELRFKDGRIEMQKVTLMFNVSVGAGRSEQFGMFDLDTIIKMLAFTNRLVSSDHFPQEIDMQPGGYFRPSGKTKAPKMLSIPTVSVVKKEDGTFAVEFTPMELGVASLPWDLYLNADDYKRGINLLRSPYFFEGNTMAQDAKMFENYGGSRAAINNARLFQYGEAARMNRSGGFVEGSAENVFVIMEEGGRYKAYTPATEEGCLPGTTRDNAIQTLESMDMKIQYAALPIRDLKFAKGILLTGTGAQLIHVNAIAEMDAVDVMAGMTRLRPEGNSHVRETVYREDFEPRTTLINNGERHEIIATIQERFKSLPFENPDMLEPVTAILDKNIEKQTQVPVEDFTTQQDRDDERAGRFHELTRDQDELRYKYRAVARKIMTALEKSFKPGIREAVHRMKKAA